MEKRKIAEKVKESVKKFKGELKKSILTAIIAAFGFLIALVWRDVINEFVNNIIKLSPLQGKLISALIITFIAAIGILVFTRLLTEK